MKKRYLYPILFGVPGFSIALLITFVLFGAITGVLWLYIFGDNPWPTLAEQLLTSLFILAFLGVWFATITAGYITGKKLEASALNKNHILLSIGLTITPILLIVAHQLSIGNLGPKSDSLLCSDFCRENSYSASGMPPKNSGDRTCSCFDNSGNEVISISLESLIRTKREAED